MTSSTKWTVAIFVVVAAFAAGMFLAETIGNELNPRNIMASSDGLPKGDTGTATSGRLTPPAASPGAAGVPKPLPQVGGNNLLLNPGGGNVGIGTFTPTEQLEITGNFRLPASTATTGIIMSGADPFIHNFGSNNFFAGVDAGNLTMTGDRNIGIGAAALRNNTTGSRNTATGDQALFNNTTGNNNTAYGISALFNNTTGSDNTATGDNALVQNTIGNSNTAYGSSALQQNNGFSNTATGTLALQLNTSGRQNTAAGEFALRDNTIGSDNTATGFRALIGNTTGTQNTAIGFQADVGAGNLFNATAIGANAIVDASNKIRLGDGAVTVIEGEVAFTFTSDVNQKENFLTVDGEETLEKIRELKLESWNYREHDPIQFRHYGPTAQDFFAAFGDDGFGTIGTETTINSGDMAGIMMIAIQALEERTADLETLRAQMAALQQRINDLETRIE